MRPRLRLFTGAEESSTAVAEPEVTVRLGEITELLAEAAFRNRTWLSDFEEDEVRISSDLYEILCMHRNLRPSA